MAEAREALTGPFMLKHSATDLYIKPAVDNLNGLAVVASEYNPGVDERSLFEVKSLRFAFRSNM